jgi:hypothetical protein
MSSSNNYPMKSTGSEVGDVLNNDHAQAGEAYLKTWHFDDWQVVVADDKTLMLDYDNKPYDGTLPEQFYTTLGIFDEVVGSDNYFVCSASKGGNTHCVIHISNPLPIVERIAWQAAFGSDPKREALHLLSVSRDELNPILLFMRKGQKLLEAGVPQHLLGDGNASE